MVDEAETKAISFDVFDTLIRRPVEKPADLFRFLDAKALRLTDGIAAEFGKTRTMCEVETRRRLEGVKDEITLDDIYDTLAAYYDLSTDQVAALKDAEIEIEVAALCIVNNKLAVQLCQWIDCSAGLFPINRLYS